jgi:hypothetical protein
MSTLEIRARAERKLAALLMLNADMEIDPAGLGVFIRANWDKLAPLAHLVHDRLDNTKDGPPDAPKLPQGEERVDAAGWIEWKGGHRPIHPDAFIEVRLRDGSRHTGRAGDRRWSHDPMVGTYDIVAYRVVSDPSDDTLPVDGWDVRFTEEDRRAIVEISNIAFNERQDTHLQPTVRGEFARISERADRLIKLVNQAKPK